MSGTQLATFGGGCFWGMEHHFHQIPGVLGTTVGYMGGSTDRPTYREVCTGSTGHAEVVQVTYDPALVTFETLLAEFWRIHDPTTLNRQGPDIGTQYRSVIFFHDEAQKEAAEKSRVEFQPRFKKPIVTEIAPAGDYWLAEDYHQQYIEKTGRPTCHLPHW